MKLAFVAGKNSTAMHGQFDADGLFEHRALTGSESSFFNVARGLAARRHTVEVYCDVVRPVENCAKLSGARVTHVDDFAARAGDSSRTYDAFVSLNEPDQLRYVSERPGLKIVQHQYNDFLNSKEGFDDFVDIYAFLSPVHRDHVVQVAKLNRNKSCWIPNSIDIRMGSATLPVEREPHTAVWCSSPDRGLHRLIEIWPIVRKLVPDAKLKIFYRFWEWIAECKDTSSKLGVRARYIAECVKRLGSNGENGVHVMGPVPNVQMAAELRSARVFPFTCDCITFTEGFSVATMDAAFAGCVPIISDADAIGDIYRDVAVVIQGKPGDQKGRWIESIVKAMSNQHWADDVGLKAAEWAEKFDVVRVASLWETLIEANKGKKSDFDFGGMPPTIDSFVHADVITPDWTGINASPQLRIAAEVPKKDAEALPRFECVSPKMRIAIILGKMSHAVHGIFDPDDLYERGQAMTGTGSNFFNLTWGLAERGHTIDAFTETTRNVIAHHRLAGANLYNLDSVQIGGDYQCYISVNEPDLLRPFSSGVRICQMQLNDFSYAAGGFDHYVDHYVFPSDRHARYMVETTGVGRTKSFAIPLSINAEFFDCDDVQRDLHRITYCSSPDRGLHNLLQIFPEIRSRVPDATLHVYYRIKPWLDSVLRTNHGDTVMRERAEIVERAIQTLGSKGENGVFVHGPVPTKVMARELLASRILAYPCDPVRFTEGFSISIMDACGAGCVPIISNADALPDVYTGAVSIIYGRPSEKKKEWTEAIVKALVDVGRSNALAYNAKAFSTNFTRQKIAKLWESFIRERLP